MHFCVFKKVKLINHECLPILMLLYIMLYIVLAYLIIIIIIMVIFKCYFSGELISQGCPTRGPRAAMQPAWCLGAAHYSFSLQVVFFSKIVT